MRNHEDLDLRGKFVDFLENIGDFKSRVKMLVEGFITVGDDGKIVARGADPTTGNLR